MDREVAHQLQSPGRAIGRGDIFWVAADQNRGSLPGSPHPHVVVQEDVFNRSRIGTVIVCALSTNLHKASEPGNVLLTAGEGGLERQSIVVASQISSIYKTRLGAYIGSLSAERVDQVIAGLRFVQRAFQGHGRSPGAVD
jgi:mRNA interferase MazF